MSLLGRACGGAGACGLERQPGAAQDRAGCDGAPPPAPSPTHRAGGARGWELPPWQRVRAALQVDPLAYVHGLGRLAPTARPSSLQPLLKRRQHTLSALCEPHLDLAGLQYTDLRVERGSTLAPAPGVAQCSLTLGTVAGVPGSGVKERTRWLSVARLCLYDGARFHGNAQVVKPREVKASKDGTEAWAFDAVPLLVRCPQAALGRMCVYIELNVSYELSPEEAARLPPKPERAARQVDEITVAWAAVELRALLPRLAAAKSVTAPLRGGPLSRRLTLKQCTQLAAQQAAQQGMEVPKKGAPGGSEPRLSVKLAPLSEAEASSSAALPECAIASPAAARVLGLYRMLLAEGRGSSEGAAATANIAPATDLTLAALPAILDDPDLSHAFFTLWERHTAPRLAPTTSELKTALRQCVAMVWALLGSQAIPPATIANHATHQWDRKRRMMEYLQAHPVAAVNSDGHQWLHRPFNAAELVHDPLRSLGVTV